MAKFSGYTIRAETSDGAIIVQKSITAISLKSAWRKAVDEAFKAIEPGTGDTPYEIQVWREYSRAQYQG